MSETTLILGAGPGARQVAEQLTARHRPVVLACTASAARNLADLNRPGCQLLAGFELAAVQGEAGDYAVSLQGRDGRRQCRAARIVLAEEHRWEPNFDLYGLTPGDTVWPLARLAAAQAAPDRAGLPAAGQSVAILHGIVRDSHPAVTETVMLSAAGLAARQGARVYVLTGNLKVAGDGLEALYRRCRQAGVVFVKFTDKSPAIQQDRERVRLVFDDEISGQPVGLSPAVTVVDETAVPSPALMRAAVVLGLERDADGFAQTDNVHRLPVETNRRGVFVLGPCRTVQGPSGHRADAAAVLSRLTAPLDHPDGGPCAEILRGGCARCLTCLRSCPHQAIVLGDRPRVLARACQGCGICAAACPAATIAFGPPEGPDLVAAIAAALQLRPEPTARPRIVALCCSRSAAPAARTAVLNGSPIAADLRIVEVPCAGAVGTGHILAALQGGADGVVVVTCHPGNCHAGSGPDHAQARMAALAALLDGGQTKQPAQNGNGAGQSPCLRLASLAANMSADFAALVTDFADSLV